jgi:hypothetical protein
MNEYERFPVLSFVTNGRNRTPFPREPVFLNGQCTYLLQYALKMISLKILTLVFPRFTNSLTTHSGLVLYPFRAFRQSSVLIGSNNKVAYIAPFSERET